MAPEEDAGFLSDTTGDEEGEERFGDLEAGRGGANELESRVDEDDEEGGCGFSNREVDLGGGGG